MKIIRSIIWVLFLLSGCGESGTAGDTALPAFQPLPSINASEEIKGEWNIKITIDYHKDIICRRLVAAFDTGKRMIVQNQFCTFPDNETELPEEIEIIHFDKNGGCHVSGTTMQTYGDIQFKDKRYGENCETSYFESVVMEFDQNADQLKGAATFRYTMNAACSPDRLTAVSCTLTGTAIGNRATEVQQTLRLPNQGGNNFIGYFSDVLSMD